MSNNFEGINIGGLGFTFKKNPEIVSNIINNFRKFLVKICDDLDENENGLFFIIDDNGLSKTHDFANWHKWLFETLAFYNEYTPLVFSLVTYPAKFDKLCEQNPSFPRMFNLIEIDKLDDKYIKQFFINNFENLNVEFEKEQYLDDMVYYFGECL